jgi:hypothetical protein
MKLMTFVLTTMFSTSMVTPAALAQGGHEHKEAKEAAKVQYQVTDSYPLDTCIVSGKALPKDPTTVTVDGRAYKLCSKECAAKIEKDVAGFADKLDAARIAAQKPRYPLTTCPVSGKPLDSMGGPKEVLVAERLVLLCCSSCQKKLVAQKDAILKKLVDAAYESQKASYKAKTCPVTGDAYDHGDAIDVMHGYTLVRLCCEDCIDQVKETPNAIAARIQQPVKAEAKDGHEHAGGKEHEGHKREGESQGKR